jgi:hypothetical protein
VPDINSTGWPLFSSVNLSVQVMDFRIIGPVGGDCLKQWFDSAGALQDPSEMDFWGQESLSRQNQRVRTFQARHQGMFSPQL